MQLTKSISMQELYFLIFYITLYLTTYIVMLYNLQRYQRFEEGKIHSLHSNSCNHKHTT
uniref:Uncharacterized protein n=1 Tax=Anguilla anguilla TaxID=7936 RepID=A0A0E9QZJ6_ANGAN